MTVDGKMLPPGNFFSFAPYNEAEVIEIIGVGDDHER